MNPDYIVSALRSGFTESQIAQGLGVTQSAVTQYIEAHSLMDRVGDMRKFENIDNLYNTMEEFALKKLQESSRMAIMNPMKWAQIVKTLNGAKRRSLSEGRAVLESGATLVQLSLPARLQVEVRKNAQNEVIEVQGRALNTLPAGKLMERIEPKTEDKSNAQTLLTPKQVGELI
jgi:predicted transcriptional regulator